MNTNESEFERELRALRPVAPSPAIEEKIARQIPTTRSLAAIETRATVLAQRERDDDRSHWLTRFFPHVGWAMAGAAAAVAILAATHRLGGPSALPVAAVAEADFEPDGVTRELVAAEDGGFIYEDAQEPARLIRYTTLERHTWIHPVTGARLEVEVPREDLVLMPVAMQ
jgi:hypothetical protein